MAADTLALGASSASAAISDGYVRGHDDYEGDWSDEGELQFDAVYDESNAACLWQKILGREG